MRPAEQRDDQETLGRYRLRGLLGEGGMGRLYVAEQTGIEGFAKIVALKRILPHLAGSEHFRDLFLDEARVAARLGHPNIVATYELGEVDGSYFMAMEYLPGEDLAAILQRCGADAPMPVEIAAFLAQQVANGLHYAHQLPDSNGEANGLVHRDVNPANIFVSYHGVAKLLDFGVVKVAQSRTKTTPGTIKGKYGYCAPEQLQGSPLDPRTDVFSLGVVLWECLTGRRLFDGPTDAGTMDAVRTEVIRPPSQLRPQVPAALDEIALRALSRERARRYQSAFELSEALDRFLSGSRIAPTAKSVGGWLETLFGAERAALKKAIGQGTDVEGALERLGQMNGAGTAVERTTTGKSPTAVRPRALWSAHVEAAGRTTSVGRRPGSSGGAAPVIAIGPHLEKAPAAPATPSGAGGRAVMVLALLIGLGAVGGVGLLVRQYGKTAAPAPAAAPPATAALEVVSQPPGAAILVDGAPSGLVTPATLGSLRVGRTFELRVDKPGYQPATQKVVVAAGAAPVTFTLEASAGVLKLEHLPPAATVYLDGSQVDLGGPLSASVGAHRLRVELGDQVIFSKTLTVHGGEQVLRIGGGRSTP